MSGLLALLDDVAGIAKVAAASVDDVAAQAAKAGAKAAGAVIDDAAVTPKYVTGFDAARELPIVGRIALGSIRNKLLILLPAALLMSAFAPWLIAPLLMLGGGYLCFEGAEKVLHWLRPKHAAVTAHEVGDPAHLEREKIAGAIKTDFILSAEIMTIALAAIPEGSIWIVGATLALVAVGITVLVYGSVALIVKADDVGLFLAQAGRLRLTRALGRGIVNAMPAFMAILLIVGTAAMLWVGGDIVIHALKEMGWPVLYTWIHDIAHAAVSGLSGPLISVLEWLIVALMDAGFGLALGMVLIPPVTRIFGGDGQGAH